jgi:cell wall-associated NlpC family hydrolase
MKLILWLSVLLITACATRPTHVAAPELSEADKKILYEDIPTYAQSLIGTPYKFGGTSPDQGFDCSGFVGDVFRHTAGITMPRTTAEISKTGFAITAADLRAGDLVFFNTLKKKFSHVGIYLGDGSFIHAPSKGGKVRIENMGDKYWQKNYDGARRINLRR